MAKLTENKYLFLFGLFASIIGLYSFFSGHSSLMDAISRDVTSSPEKKNTVPRTSIHKFSKGYINDLSYYNPFFDFNISVPAKWEVMPQAYRDSLMVASFKVLQTDSAELNEALGKTRSKNEILFQANKFRQDTKNRYSPYVLVMGEDIEQFGHITSKDYAESTLKILNAGNRDNNINLQGVPIPVLIQGEEFYCLKTSSYIDRSVVKCEVYMLVKNMNVLIFSLAYVTDEDKKDCETILKTIWFGKPDFFTD